MTDDTITFEDGGKVVLTYDRKLDGYQGIMNLEDAIRAYRDRPSMEAELQALRTEVERLNQSLTGAIENYEREAMENVQLRAKCEQMESEHRARAYFEMKCQRYEAALRQLDEWGVDDTDKWNQEHPNEEGLYLFDAEAMCAFAEWALNDAPDAGKKEG